MLLASVSAVPLNVAAAQHDKVDATVRQQAAAHPGDVPVLITRRSSSGALQTLNTHHAKVKQQLKIGNIVAASVASAELEAIAADPDVVRIAYDAPTHLTSASPDPLTMTSNLKSVFPIAVQASQAWNAPNPIRGTGVGIAVIDSGIDTGHNDFYGSLFSGPNAATRISMLWGFYNGGLSALADDNGHGTWVSGIAAGRGWSWATNTTEGQYIGIAPDARLVSIKVTDRDGQSHVSDVMAALQWAVDNQAVYNIRVINLSLVSDVAESYTTSSLDAAVEMAWLHGIAVVVAAGNSGPNTLQYAPANDPFVITVGATDDLGTASTADDRLTSWSSYGSTQDGFAKPELVAPGRHIVGTLSSGSVTLATQYPNNIVDSHKLYIQLSGTSASAPIVTGLVADLLQSRPTLKPDDVKGLFMQTALPIPGIGTGAGYPQLMNAATSQATINRANVNVVPNNYIASAGCATLPTGTDCSQTNWSSVSWNSVSWNSVSWNSVSWNSVSWNSVSWNSVSGN